MNDAEIKAKRREWQSKGGRRTAELGKSGFKTMTREQKVAAGKEGHKAMLASMRKKESEK